MNESDLIKLKYKVGDLWDLIFSLWGYINDSRKGNFSPDWGAIAVFTAALVYLINPMDLVPDILPGGYLDDAAVISAAATQYFNEISRWKDWKKRNP